jgi:hypothetical protein
MKTNPTICAGMLVAALAGLAASFNHSDLRTEELKASTPDHSRPTSQKPHRERHEAMRTKRNRDPRPAHEKPYPEGDFISESTTLPFDQASAHLRNDPDDAARLFPDSEIFGNGRLSEKESIESLLRLFAEYQTVAMEKASAAASNIGATNALLGDNPRNIALLQRSHSRIDASGQLVDSWGTPYHFVESSVAAIKIRSAGADRVLNTDDDIVSENN